MVYTSIQNPLIKEIASLKDKKHRALKGLYIAEGVKMVNEAISFNKDIEYIVSISEMLPLISKTNAKILEVTPKVFKYISDETTPQGVLAVLKIPSMAVKKPIGNCLLLDGVSDPGNLGTIIRTACAFNYKDIYLLNCVDPYSNKVVRASMSGIYNVNLYKGDFLSIKEALEGYMVIAGDLKGENLNDFTPPKNFCIAVGNEANGLSNEVKSLANKIVTIKMDNNQESLNVAIATAILMYKLK
ncbi:MAG: RNA methyltransferase [Clostridia bacterium]|nr:RNA methyltransferase [Clostridia bacterium]